MVSTGTAPALARWRYRARPGQIGFAAWLFAILLALIGADVISLYRHGGSVYRLDVGMWFDPELQFLDGVFEPEVDQAGNTYRWTAAESAFTVRGFASVPNPTLSLHIGGAPQSADTPRPVRLSLDGTAITLPVAAESRRYALALPTGALVDGDLRLTFVSPTSRVPPDRRDIAFRLDAIDLGWERSALVFPTWWMLLSQCLIVITWIGIARRLGLPRWSRYGLGVGLILLLSWMTGYTLLTATAWQSRLMAYSLVLLALVWRAVPLLNRSFPELGTRRDVRLLCIITVLAIAVRLFGLLYPRFSSHDLYIHRERLRDVQLGTTQLFDTPSEFGDRQTIVPPMFYLMVSPLTLLTVDAGPAIQGLYGLLDGSSVLVLALLVRRLGGSATAATIAAVALLGFPIQLTALWWGFAPQVIGQWFLLVLAVILSGPSPPTRTARLAAGAALCLALLTHQGSAVLNGAWLILFVVLEGCLRPRERAWRQWAAVFAGAVAVVLALLYSEVVLLQLQGAVGGAAEPQRFGEAVRLRLLGQGLVASLRPLSIPLTIACLVALMLRIRARHRLLIGAWLASACLFLAVDVAVGLQVRYAYFAMPLVCAGLGLLLDIVMVRHHWVRLAGWSIVGLVLASGLSLWLDGALWFVKPTLTALTH